MDVWKQLTTEGTKSQKTCPLCVFPTLSSNELYSDPIYLSLPLQVVTCASDWLATHWKFQQPPPLVHFIARVAHRTQRNTLFIWLLGNYKRLLLRKGQMKSYVGQSIWEGAWSFHVLSAQLSLNLHVFTNLEVLGTFSQAHPVFWGCYGSFIT